MPLTAPLSDQEPYTVKFCRDESYKNTIRHEASGQEFSVPPAESGELQTTVNRGLMQAHEIVKDGILGEPGKSVKIDKYRVCW